MRLIDADALKNHYAWWKSGTRKYSLEGMRVIFDSIIDEQPTINPVRPVCGCVMDGEKEDERAD